jgi:penicillin amidase
MATVLALTNDWEYILERERFNAAIGRDAVEELTPLGDPTYDIPIQGRPAPVSCRPPVRATPPTLAVNAVNAVDFPPSSHSPVEASNAWAVGGAHTTDGHALVANDPHLDYSVPAPWYLVELRAPGLHVTGATLPGTPGIVLGHNDTFAWGVTSVGASTMTVYRDPLRAVRSVEQGNVAVRFGFPKPFEARVTPHGFVVATDDKAAYAAEWAADRDARSPLATFLALDRASSIDEALRTLSRFPGPPLNVVLGERGGRVAYHMAGLIPNDGVWSRYVVDGSRVKDAWHGYVPFDQLPHVDPSREAVVVTANDRIYGSGYPYRLADHFMPAYRARRIHDLLQSRGPLNADDLRRFQLDVLSLPEYEFARGVADHLAQKKDPSENDRVVSWELRNWDGRMSPESRVATLTYRLRDAALDRYASLVLGTKLGALWRENVGDTEATASMLCAIRSHAVGYDALLDSQVMKTTDTAWETEHSVFLHHPLRALEVSLFDPPPFGGSGDFASIKVQTAKHGQSFRAVWDVGAWDQGGIVMPLGESGRPGSAHYDDEQQAFTQGRLLPLTLTKSAPGAKTLRLEPKP